MIRIGLGKSGITTEVIHIPNRFLKGKELLYLLIVAKRGLRKLLNQEAGKEQLQLMLDFLKKLAEENIPVIDFQKSNLQVLATLYDTSIMEYSDGDINTSFEFYDMYTEGGHHSIAYTYLRNPLMPASVIKKIKKFRDLPTVEFRFRKEDLVSNFWLIGGYIPKGRLELQPMRKYTGGIIQYVEACVELKDSVKHWFKAKGVTDLNTEFIN
jgi:hypothetical protein